MGRAVDGNGWEAQYKIIVETPFENYGKFYSMVLKELRDFGYKNLIRIEQSLSASPTSAFHASISQRRAQAKEQFDNGMGLIYNAIQSITKLIYSLREFDQTLEIFKQLKSKKSSQKEAAELNLKRIFMDEVDIKKGRGSINNLTTTQGLEYVALRDLFLIAEKGKVKELNTNDNLKKILKGRIEEYEDWKKEFKKDVEGRYQIQKEFLRNQVEVMKIQLNWVKPYYVLMQQLNIDTGVANPKLIAGVDSNIITTKIRGFITGSNSLVTAFTDVDFKFKSGPMQTRSAQGQVASQYLNTIEIVYTPYIMSNEEYAKFVKEETFKDIDFLKSIVGESLDNIKDDLDKYLEGKDIKEEEKVEKKKSSMLDFLLQPVFALLSPFKRLIPKKKEKKNYDTYQLNNQLKEQNDAIVSRTADVYGNFKDENGYITWSASLN